MRNKLVHLPIFHHNESGFEKKASWLELFYDLMYVASFIQMGNTFSDNISFPMFLKTCLIFVSFWISWSGFTYFANRYSVDDFLHRVLVFGHMFLVASMTVLIPRVLADDTVLFSILFACSQFVVSLMYFRVLIQNQFGASYTKHWMKIFFISGLIWFVSAFFPSDYVYLVWIIGILAVLIAPFSKKSIALAEEIPFDQEHLSERYGLLTIIVLGESFVKVLSELVGSASGENLILQACFALLLACSIWWTYFDDVAESELVEKSLAMPVWLMSHIPLQLGLVFMGVGIKKAVIFDFSTPLTSKYAYLVSFSIATVLFCVALVDMVTKRKNSSVTNNTRVILRVISAVFCVLVGVTASYFTNFVLLSLLLLLVVIQILVDLVFSPYSSADIDQAQVQKQKKPNRELKSNERLIRKGVPDDFRNDLYYTFITSSWISLLAVVFLYFILSNLFFAFLYLIVGGIPGETSIPFHDAFFFSVQTMSTIGYGVLAPQGFAANIIVTIEAAYGLISVALITGMVFHKISRPNAKVLFSSKILDSKFDGQRCLSFRLGNVRGNDLVEANLKLSLLRDEVTAEGRKFRRIYDLNLKRSRTPFFIQTWNVFHPIDQDSPLYTGDDHEIGDFDRIIVTLTGHDGVFSNTIYSRHTYDRADVVKDQYFVDVVEHVADGSTIIDYAKFHSLESPSS